MARFVPAAVRATVPAPAPNPVSTLGPAPATAQTQHAQQALGNVGRGLAFGALGVAIFAMTLPMTRLAVGDASAPQLPPAFVSAGRAAVAGPVLGERSDAVTVLFSMAVMAVVLVGRRLPAPA